MARSEVMSIEYCLPPRTTAVDDGSMTATILQKGDEGSYLKMQDSGRLSLGPGDADTEEATCEWHKLHVECVGMNVLLFHLQSQTDSVWNTKGSWLRLPVVLISEASLHTPRL